MTDFVQTLGQRVAFVIETSGVDIRDVAKKCDVSVQAVYGWMKDGVKDLRMSNLFTLADMTGFEARWISLGQGPMRIDQSIRHAETILAAMEPETRYTAVRLIDTLAEPPRKVSTQ